MKIKKEILLELLDADNEEVVENVKRVDHTDNGTSRWSSHHTLIVDVDGKYYAAPYRCGLTELQEEYPWEYSGYEIECYEVKPIEKTVVEYVKVQ